MMAEDGFLLSNSTKFLPLKRKKTLKRARVPRLGLSLNTFFLTSLSVGLSLKNFVFNLLFGGIN